MAYLYINYMPARYCTEKITGPLDAIRAKLARGGGIDDLNVYLPAVMEHPYTPAPPVPVAGQRKRSRRQGPSGCKTSAGAQLTNAKVDAEAEAERKRIALLKSLYVS
jgi:hypothetical protein